MKYFTKKKDWVKIINDVFFTDQRMLYIFWGRFKQYIAIILLRNMTINVQIFRPGFLATALCTLTI